jgi:hypothetical protein
MFGVWAIQLRSSPMQPKPLLGGMVQWRYVAKDNVAIRETL